MATIIHRNSGSYDGIWVLDKNAIEKLDSIIDEACRKLKDIRRLKIKEAAEQEFKNFLQFEKNEEISDEQKEKRYQKIESRIKEYYPFRYNNRNVTLSMMSGQKLKASSFKEAMENPNIQEQKTLSFDIHFHIHEIEGEVRLYRNNISISVTPEANEEASTVFIKLEQWLQQYKSPKLLYLWNKNNGFIQFTVSLILLFLMLPIAIERSNPIIDNLKVQAASILKGGISQGEISQALEILLSLETASGNGEIIRIKSWVWLFLILYSSALILSLFPPSSIIGIGKGVVSIQRQKIWLKFVVVLIPSFIFLGVLASFLGSLLFSSLR